VTVLRIRDLLYQRTVAEREKKCNEQENSHKEQGSIRKEQGNIRCKQGNIRSEPGNIRSEPGIILSEYENTPRTMVEHFFAQITVLKYYIHRRVL
jgi:hypothetical protein